MSQRPLTLPLGAALALLGLLAGVVADRITLATTLGGMAATLEDNRKIMQRIEDREKEFSTLTALIRAHQLRNEGLIDLHSQELNVLLRKNGLPQVAFPPAATPSDK